MDGPPNGGSAAEDDIDALLQKAQANAAEGGGNFLDDLNNRELDRGEKAADAVDYEDISDDDLPEEEEAPGGGDDDDGFNLDDFSNTTAQDPEPGVDNDDDAMERELFGDDSDVEPDDAHHKDNPLVSIEGAGRGEGQAAPRNVAFGAAQPEEDDDDDPEYREQMALFNQARSKRPEDQEQEAPKTTLEEFEKVWPNFEPDKPPRFFSLVPRKRAYYIPKVPQKPPKLMPRDCARPGEEFPTARSRGYHQGRAAGGGARRVDLHYG
jgi:hypothetical protein